MVLINSIVLNRLTHSMRRSPIDRFKFQPTKIMINYLIRKYQLGNNFQNGSKFLKDHSFVTRRFFNESDYCEVLKEENGQFCFEIKLSKPRKKSILLNNKLDKPDIFFRPELHFEVVVESEKSE